MAIIPPYLRRPTAILKIPQAIAQGLTPSAFLRQLKSVGLGYRRQLFLSDWRSVSGIKKRKDAFKFVRKDRLPSMKVLADVEWDMSSEYMYKVNAHVRTSPDEPLKDRFVNITSDRPLTPQEVIEEVYKRWDSWETYAGEMLERAEVIAGVHRIPEEEPEF